MSNLDLKPIPAGDLLALNDYQGSHPLQVDLVYANAFHVDNMFKTAIYHPEAKMWGHKDMVEVVLKAAEICYADTGYIFEVKDCLRTTEAQELMRQTDIVKAHPQWLEEPGRLLSPPGKGGHPRGMAVDIVLLDKKGDELDMGTRFDYLTEDRANNPAARHYTDFGRGDAYNKMILNHRQMLESAMVAAGKFYNRPILPLPQEWWDFRFMPDYTNQFRPISDADLPPQQRMTDL